jgi:hypothetical protein
MARVSALFTAASLLLVVPVVSATAADLTARQREGVCRVSLARINANSAGEYRVLTRSPQELGFASGSGYDYQCRFSGDWEKLFLSSSGWGRLTPTAKLTRKGSCVSIELYDPGFRAEHQLRYCE